MSKQKPQVTTLALPVAGNDSSSDTGLLIKKYVYHWPLFVLGVVAAVIGAYFYLKVAKPVYPILATLEFKAPTASSASLTVNSNSTTQELDPIDKPIIVENEIEIMQSKKLIYQVVNQLQLWVSYTQKKGVVSKDLYKDTPVKFAFVKQEGTLGPAGEKIQIKINNKNSFTYKDPTGNSKNIAFSSPVKSSFGTWQLVTTPNIENYIDSTIVVKIDDPDLVTDGVQKGIKVELENKDAPFVNLSTSDPVPQRGKDVLNSLMALYLEFAIEDKNKLSQKTLKFIDFRLDSLKDELDTAERRIQQFKNNNDITVSIDTEAIGYQHIRQENLKNLNDIQVQLGVLSSLDKFAVSSLNSDQLPALSSAITDPGLAAMYDKLTQLQLRRDQLLGSTPETSPMVVEVNKQINTLKNNFVEKLQSTRAALLAQKQQLQSIVSDAKSYLQKVPGQDREYASLKRYQQSKENIYKFLLEKREQVALRYASSISDSEIVDDAHAGKVKWPIVPIVYLLALIIGLGIAAAILYLRDSLNDLITSRRQIEDETELPILGELAYQETDKQIVVSEGRSKFAIGEQFRVLRTNLYHLHGNNAETGRVTLFTSSVSGEGKSFVSSNLAVTLAYASRKTIILEMDLRKPKVSVNFGLDSEHIGISNYLTGETTDLKKMIQPSGIPDLDVLSCGAILPNPSELLEREKLDELIATLRIQYDDIIIDSPPIHLVTDALVIARVADASLYVVRQGYTHKYELEFVNEINEANRFPKFTIVFNGIKGSSSGYGYGYGYGYGGSNYYNAYTEKPSRSFGEVLKDILKRF